MYVYNATTAVPEPHESTLYELVTTDPVPQPAQMMHDLFTFEKMVKHMLGQFLNWTEIVRTVPRIIEVACRKEVRDHLPERCQMEKPIELSFRSYHVLRGSVSTVLTATG